MPTYARPGLVFHSVDEMVADVDQLCIGPCQTCGEWTLPMILDHLAKGMRGDGLKPVPWIARPIVRTVVKLMVKLGKYPAIRIPAAKELKPAADLPLDAARAEFNAAAEGLKSIPGPRVDTPFGSILKVDFTKLMLMHGAHHLSFVKAAVVATSGH